MGSIWAVADDVSVEEEGENPVNPLAVQLVREHPPEYTPGTLFEIKVTILADYPEAITAVGLRETMPPGWQFQTIRAYSGDPPSVIPPEGATGVLEFAWVTIPELPYSFAYSLLIPEGDRGNKFLHGAFEYRTQGAALYAPPLITSVEGPPNQPPKLTLLGENPMTLERGQSYEEPGYTATDPEEGDISSQVQVDGVVDVYRVGEYSLRYSVSDQAGEQAAPQVRTVMVVLPEGEEGETLPGAVRSGSTYYGGGTSGAWERRSQNSTQSNRPQNYPKFQQNSIASQNRAERARQIQQERAAAEALRKESEQQPLKTDALLRGSNTAHRIANNIREAGAKERKEKMQQSTETGQTATQSITASADAPTRQRSASHSTDAATTTQNASTPKKALEAITPDAPQLGVLESARLAFSSMTAGQWMALGIVFLLALIIAGCAIFAWRFAYRAPVRRRVRPKQTDTET